MSDDERFWVFFGLWTALAIAQALMFRRMSVASKTRWAPRATILNGLLFIGFTAWVIGSLEILYVTVPATVIFVLVGLKWAKICPKCGSDYLAWRIGKRVIYCSKCGFDLRTSDNGATPA